MTEEDIISLEIAESLPGLQRGDRHALWRLHELFKCNKSAVSLAAPVIPQLIKLLLISLNRVVLIAVETLTYIVQDCPANQKTAGSSIISHLILILNDPHGDESLRISAAKLLSGLSCLFVDSEHSSEPSYGFVPHLMRVLENAREPWVKIYVLKTLGDMFKTNKDNRRRVGVLCIKPILHMLATWPKDGRLQQLMRVLALIVLVNIFIDKGNAILGMDSIEPLILLMEESIDSETRSMIMTALCNLFVYSGNRRTICIDPLVWTLMTSKDNETLAIAAQALGNLLHDNEANKIIASSNTTLIDKLWRLKSNQAIDAEITWVLNHLDVKMAIQIEISPSCSSTNPRVEF